MAEGVDGAWTPRPGQALDMQIWSGPGREFEVVQKATGRHWKILAEGQDQICVLKGSVCLL